MATAALPHTDVAGIARPGGSLDLAHALEPYTGPWNARLAAHLLRRAGFGAGAADVSRLAAMPVHAAVDGLVDFPGTQSLPAPPALFDARQYIMQNVMGGMRALMGDDAEKRELFK